MITGVMVLVLIVLIISFIEYLIPLPKYYNDPRDWVYYTSYQKGDIVRFEGKSYQAVINFDNSVFEPRDDPRIGWSLINEEVYSN